MAPKSQGPRLLADPDHPNEAVPAVVADPAEAQDPPAAAEVQVRDVHATAGAPPLGAGGHEVEWTKLHRDVLGLRQEAFQVVLAALGPVHLTCAGEDGLAVDVLLAFPQEAEEVQGGLSFDLRAFFEELPALGTLIVDEARGGLQGHSWQCRHRSPP